MAYVEIAVGRIPAHWLRRLLCVFGHDWESLQGCNGRRHWFWDECRRCGRVFPQPYFLRSCYDACPVNRPGRSVASPSGRMA